MNRIVALAVLIGTAPLLQGQEPTLRESAAKGMRKAVEYFRAQVATEGGYLWRYSADLKQGEGEGKATPSMIWVQPPGTPSVGMAYLTAYEATGDAYYLDAARDAARCLVKGQLRSGGWDYFIDFDPARRKQFAYRSEPGTEAGKGMTTFDDNNSQSALRLLMRVDRALQFKDESIHEAAQFALASLLKAQYPNGAWPQRYERFPDPEKFPVKKASYPGSWSRTWPGSDYRAHYTFNDNAIADLVETLLEAERTYKEPKYKAAAEKAGGFILLAQLPDPQPAWAQQYDADMYPAWARRFEPPSVTGGESQRVMRTLLQLYRETGERKYLEPIPRAVAYLRRSALPDGRLVRFYELKTNKPLYFTKDYKLTYSDDDLPTHYGFKVSNNLDAIAREYEQLKSLDPADLKKPAKPAKPPVTEALTARTKAVLQAQDKEGRWLIEGRLRSYTPEGKTERIIDCAMFIQNLGVLSAYLAASRE